MNSYGRILLIKGHLFHTRVCISPREVRHIFRIRTWSYYDNDNDNNDDNDNNPTKTCCGVTENTPVCTVQKLVSLFSWNKDSSAVLSIPQMKQSLCLHRFRMTHMPLMCFSWIACIKIKHWKILFSSKRQKFSPRQSDSSLTLWHYICGLSF